jgi:hypothetical protein
MQKEYTLGRGGEALAEGALVQQMAPWVYFYSWPDGRDAASPEPTMKLPQWQL